jgi:hypothetical protein
MPSRKTLNKHQKAARRCGEPRVNAPEVAELLRCAESDDADDRLLAARWLCPCHVRRPDDAVSTALHRLMEDADVRVRRAAWHTIEDGGGGATLDVQAIADRVWERETDAQVRQFIEEFCGSPLERRRASDRAAVAPVVAEIGRCDFCGASSVRVATDYDTPIPTDTRGGTRAAKICMTCRQR